MRARILFSWILAWVQLRHATSFSIEVWCDAKDARTTTTRVVMGKLRASANTTVDQFFKDHKEKIHDNCLKHCCNLGTCLVGTVKESGNTTACLVYGSYVKDLCTFTKTAGETICHRNTIAMPLAATLLGSSSLAEVASTTASAFTRSMNTTSKPETTRSSSTTKPTTTESATTSEHTTMRIDLTRDEAWHHLLKLLKSSVKPRKGVQFNANSIAGSMTTVSKDAVYKKTMLTKPQSLIHEHPASVVASTPATTEETTYTEANLQEEASSTTTVRSTITATSAVDLTTTNRATVTTTPVTTTSTATTESPTTTTSSTITSRSTDTTTPVTTTSPSVTTENPATTRSPTTASRPTVTTTSKTTTRPARTEDPSTTRNPTTASRPTVTTTPATTTSRGTTESPTHPTSARQMTTTSSPTTAPMTTTSTTVFLATQTATSAPPLWETMLTRSNHSSTAETPATSTAIPQSPRIKIQESSTSSAVKDTAPVRVHAHTTFVVEVDHNEESAPMGLIVGLSLGLVFIFIVLGVVGRQILELWQRRHYSRMDFLVDGMYH
ncbi:mucin-5AC-like [Ornithodoros turicata]|uniref:mucin-5AC-like n=1 Tax=Ornithodoros turicata TaxID=34597 RepID=UPI003138F565